MWCPAAARPRCGTHRRLAGTQSQSRPLRRSTRGHSAATKQSHAASKHSKTAILQRCSTKTNSFGDPARAALKSAVGSHERAASTRRRGAFEACAAARRACVGSAHYRVALVAAVGPVTAQTTRHAARLKAAFSGAAAADRTALCGLGDLPRGGGGCASSEPFPAQCGVSGALGADVSRGHWANTPARPPSDCKAGEARSDWHRTLGPRPSSSHPAPPAQRPLPPSVPHLMATAAPLSVCPSASRHTSAKAIRPFTEMPNIHNKAAEPLW